MENRGRSFTKGKIMDTVKVFYGLLLEIFGIGRCSRKHLCETKVDNIGQLKFEHDAPTRVAQNSSIGCLDNLVQAE